MRSSGQCQVGCFGRSSKPTLLVPTSLTRKENKPLNPSLEPGLQSTTRHSTCKFIPLLHFFNCLLSFIVHMHEQLTAHREWFGSSFSQCCFHLCLWCCENYQFCFRLIVTTFTIFAKCYIHSRHLQNASLVKFLLFLVCSQHIFVHQDTKFNANGRF